MPFFGKFFRRIHFDEDAITVFKLLRKKSLKFSKLTEVESLRVKKRVFFDPEYGRRFYHHVKRVRRLPAAGQFHSELCTGPDRDR